MSLRKVFAATQTIEARVNNTFQSLRNVSVSRPEFPTKAIHTFRASSNGLLKPCTTCLHNDHSRSRSWDSSRGYCNTILQDNNATEEEPAKSSLVSLASRIGASPRKFSSSTRNRQGVNTDLPLLSGLNRGGAAEIPSGSKKVVPVRSVVTSQKVAEVDRRGRMEEPKLMSKEERQEFNALFPQLLRDLTEIPEYRDMADTNRWLTKVLQYNVPHGKRNRGLATALAYRYMTSDLTEENVKLSFVLGWCVEIMQAFYLVADDIMDQSETRRGRACWYKVDNLGVNGFNDAILLESTLYILLKKYFRNKEYYADLLDIFHDVNHKTIYGQSLDTRTGMEHNMETYTMDRYNGIVKYKTSFYSFYLPVRLAMAMAGINDLDLQQQVRTVTLEMGHFFQVQDDYLDCFGDAEVTGKVGTDIQDCKCSWLFVVALQKCSAEQKKVLLENYGQNDASKIANVKKMYEELEISETYSVYEEQSYNLISTHIRQMADKLPKQLFYDMLNKIYRRNQ